MSFFSYNLNIPAANDNPSDDQPLMQTNTNSISDLILVDHRGFEDADNLGGYHTDIHQVPLGNYNVFTDGGTPPVPPAPVNIAGINQLFVLNVTPDSTTAPADTQLFALTASNGLSQLTGNRSAEEGYQWIGGALIQWGTVLFSTGVGTNTHLVGDVTFKDRDGMPSTIPFPNNCFSVQLTFAILLSSTTSSSNTLFVQNKTNTGFKWVANSNSSSFAANFVKFYWVAIGN